jgi:hypothetical protein
MYTKYVPPTASYHRKAGLRIRITLKRVRIQLFTLMRTRIPLSGDTVIRICNPRRRTTEDILKKWEEIYQGPPGQGWKPSSYSIGYFSSLRSGAKIRKKSCLKN